MPFLYLAGTLCLSLNYHMKGRGVGTFNIYQRYSSGQRRTLFTSSGDQGNFWKDFQLQLREESQPYKVYITC